MSDHAEPISVTASSRSLLLSCACIYFIIIQGKLHAIHVKV